MRETQEPPLGMGTSLSDYAVLSRTNAELHEFETACCLAEIPYARAGGSGLFDAPESKAVLGYIDLAYGVDYKRMEKSLVDALTKPERGLFLGHDKVAQIVRDTFEDVARMVGQDIRQVNPADLLTQRYFATQLATNLKMPYRHKITNDYAWKKAVENLTENLLDMGRQIIALREMARRGGSAEDLLSYILDNVSSTVTMWDRVERREVITTKTLREQIQEDVSINSDEDEEDEELAEPEVEVTPEGEVLGVRKKNPAKGLGSVQFLYLMIQPNARDAEEGTDPSTADGFIKKLARVRANADKLRVNLQAWAKEQAAKPEGQREKRPNCVILSTIHCSPPDEPILTTDGWVAIGDLDPLKHRLASYSRLDDQLLWGSSFIKDSRYYRGTLITMTTETSQTRVTAEHRVLARFANSFMDKYVVYLMRRGQWWHVGVCAAMHHGLLGVEHQLETELANAVWILGVFDTMDGAMVESSRIQALYGVPGLGFEYADASAEVHRVHESIKDTVAPKVHAMLRDFGLDAEYPLHVRGEIPDDLRGAFVLRACNLLEGFMEVPVVSDAFAAGADSPSTPIWVPVSVKREHYDGPVYSVTVLPHRFYVSGGTVVHNSVKGAEWKDTTVLMAPGVFPRDHKVAPGEEPPTDEELDAEEVAERNLAYVAMTRAAQNLTILCTQSPGHTGLSRFVLEAGLDVGENVQKPVAVSQGEPRTASWHEKDLDAEYLADLELLATQEYTYER
jgi:hypothetical protein